MLSQRLAAGARWGSLAASRCQLSPGQEPRGHAALPPLLQEQGPEKALASWPGLHGSGHHRG